MAETKNIDAMAALISDDIFNEMKWLLHEKRDINWECRIPEHNKVTHPTDVVFSYKDPYSARTIYIQTDLKSYNKRSLSLTKRINEAVESLALQVECARSSKEWRTLFRCVMHNADLNGMLFLYNNDDEYDRDLLSNLGNTASKDFSIQSSSKIYIFSPKIIKFLMSCVENINERRTINESSSSEKVWEKIPIREECGFFYPDKQNRIADQAPDHPATLEMITSGMLLLSYEHPIYEEKILNIYWDEIVSSIEAFIYLFEYMFNYQMLSNFGKIYLILPFRDEKTYDLFESARATYMSAYAANEGQKEKLKKINLILPRKFVTQIYLNEVADGRHIQ